MSRETKMAIEHSIPMPQRSESGVSARYETKVFSLWDREAWGELMDSVMKLNEYLNSSAGGVAKPFDGAILLESVRVTLQS
jgi:hypothetical protein